MGSAWSAQTDSKSKSNIDARTSLLFALYEPDRDPSALSSQTWDTYSQINHNRDMMNLWARVAPSYSPVEKAAVELWRQQVDAHLTARISSYQNPTPEVTSVTSEPPSRSQQPSYHPEHRVFQIPELLDLILQFAGPGPQLRALHVSTVWRSHALFVISSRMNIDAFWTSPLSAPIEYGQVIEQDTLAPPRPSSAQIEHFGLHVQRIFERWPNTRRSKCLYFPARFAQLRDLPGPISHALNELDVHQRGEIYSDTHSVTRDTDVYWLDLSQFKINPYLDLLFAEENRITHRLGRWEISLRAMATPDTLLLDIFSSSKPLLDAIGSMHVTQPPCRALGIYYHNPSVLTLGGFNALLTRVRNDDGVRISELLDALNRSAPTVLSAWVKSAERLCDRIKGAHWIDDLWIVPGSPKFEIRLDSIDMSDEELDVDSITSRATMTAVERAAAATLGYPAHITRMAYMIAQPFRASRLGEWLPKDLFEPMKSTTGRHQINWDT